MEEKFKENSGITLIALVVTIIVLLILAGVSIAMLTGENGILTQAQRAKTETENAAANEAGMLNEMEQTISDKTNGVEESVSGKYYDEDTDVRVGDYIVAIPGGATVSNIAGEYESVDNGFVIYITNGEEVDWSNPEEVQRKYDQFVWMPVDKETVIIEEGKEITGSTEAEKYESLQSYITNTAAPKGKYPMAVKKTDGAYCGILYDFTEENDGIKVTPKDYTTTSSNREPDVVSYDTGTYASEGVTKTGLQAEYKEMIEGVEAEGGFWVGRYETSNMSSSSSNDDINAIKVVKGTTNGINNLQWYRMYAQQKNYDDLKLEKSSNVKSSMIWGSQWDQIMIWMKDVQNKVNTTNGNYYITNSVGMGNFGINNDGYSDTSNPASTGCFFVKNIYDLSGNVNDWTLEVGVTVNRVTRRR